MNQASVPAKDKVILVLFEDINVLSEKNYSIQNTDYPLLNDKDSNVPRYIFNEHNPYILREDSGGYSADSDHSQENTDTSPSNTRTPYDDVFRTLATDCPKLLIPLVNELFHEDLKGSETVSLFSDIHFILTEDGSKRKRETDSYFSIAANDSAKRYHIECQSTEDNSMFLRMFEYTAVIATHNSQMVGGRLVIPFPRSAMIALRHTQSTPDTMELMIQTPDDTVSYFVPVLKIGQYTWQELFEKKLYFLLPFHLFIYEKRFKKAEKDKHLLQWLEGQYKQIMADLSRLCECGEITEYTRQTILSMSRKVLTALTSNHNKLMEGIGKIMGGQILEYEAKTIMKEGIREGRLAGIREGRQVGIREGRQAGIREGRQTGLQEGRSALGREALELIRAGKLEEAEKLLENPNQNIDIS